MKLGKLQKVGSIYNDRPISNTNDKACSDCCCSAFCLSCMMASRVEESTGLNWWLQCCFGSVCGARNIIRYQNKITGSDIGNDCMHPAGIYAAMYFCPCFMPCICLPWVSYWSETSNIARTGHKGPYLSIGKNEADNTNNYSTVKIKGDNINKMGQNNTVLPINTAEVNPSQHYEPFPVLVATPSAPPSKIKESDR